MSSDKKQKENNQLAQEWKSSEINLATYAAHKHIPLGGIFELTPRCNLRCKMCYVRLDRPQMDKIGRELTANEWIALAKDAAEAGTLNLLITGGEPLLRDDFAEIYTALANMGFVISLNTNATLMNPELLKLFKKYPPTATNVTLYGASPETYEKISGNPGGFYQTLRGLDMLSEVSTVLEVRTTFIKDNMNELDELREIANRYTKVFAINTDVFKAVRGANTAVEGCRLDPAQTFEINKLNEEYYKINGEQGEIAQEGNMDTDYSAYDRNVEFSLPPEIIPCLAAKSMYWITWDGKMLPCGTFSSPYTLPIQEGFKIAWNRLPSLFDKVTHPEECTTCEFADSDCPKCPAKIQAESGSFSKIDPYICEIAKERAKRRISRV